MPHEQYTLESLLNDKDLRTDFIFYVNKRHAQESLLFWMEVEMFKRIVDSDECLKQAKLLYVRYLHPNSRSEINVEGRVKSELEKIMATGIWDQTLFDKAQLSVHECLKFSVVREFGEYITKQRLQTENPEMTAAHVLLERYDGAVNKDYGTLRKSKGFGWLKKKTQSAIVSSPTTEKNKDDKSRSLLGKYRIGKSKTKAPIPSFSPPLSPISEDKEDNQENGENDHEIELPTRHRERLSQQRLQEQIQLLRNLHQQQSMYGLSSGNSGLGNGNAEMMQMQYATVEFASAPVTTLAKSVSMPSILARGVSVVQLRGKD